jgi:hypothetical protein
VPGGGLSADGQRWVRCRARFFLSVRVLSRLFRRLFLESLEKAFNSGKLQFFAALEFLRDPHAFAERIWLTATGSVTATRVCCASCERFADR